MLSSRFMDALSWLEYLAFDAGDQLGRLRCALEDDDCRDNQGWQAGVYMAAALEWYDAREAAR